MVRKDKVGRQNGAKMSKNRYRHAKRCENKQKQMLAHKTVGKQAKTDAGTQNGVKIRKGEE